MSDKNLSSTHLIPVNRQRSDSNPESIDFQSTAETSSKGTTPYLKRRFSGTKMLAKAKDSTKSLVNEVLEKRHSLDSKRSMDEYRAFNASTPSSKINDYSSSSLTSLEKLQVPISPSGSTNNLIEDNATKRTLSSKQKHYSFPIRRPFTIKKDRTSSLESSVSSFSSSSSTAAQNVSESTSQLLQFSNAAAAAEADILSGAERPGSFATACEFRLAAGRRNEEFHALFKSVPESDMLIQDYKCALRKDVLLQGHLYVSEHHVCFKSNIFGWVTNLVIKFEEITEVEKKMTAKIIPNGIIISTSTSKHILASFLSRDQAYDQIVKIWDLCKRANSVIPSSSAYFDDNSLYEEGDTDEDSIPSMYSAVAVNNPPLLITTIENDHNDKIKSTNMIPTNSAPPTDVIKTTSKPALLPSAKNSFQLQTAAFSARRPRAASDSYRERHVSVEPITESDSKRENVLRDTQIITPIKKTRVCPCTVKGDQYSHIALNETYNGTVQAMFKLLFDSDFFKGFLENYENFEDVQLGNWKHGTREVMGKRKIKSSSLGTKVVKTLFQERRIHRKYPYYSCVTAKKFMPDMPMGAVYCIQSRTCITRVDKDKVHLLVTFQVAFSKSGLVSSIIEKNAADDQMKLFSRLRSILNKPNLIRELVSDTQLLQDLNMLKGLSTKEESSMHQDQSWVSFALHRIQSFRLIDFIYIGFFVVLMTHCTLALRLQHITHRLDNVQQQKLQHPTHEDSKVLQWMDERMAHVRQSLSQLKGEAQDYDQRILKMKNA